MTDNVESRIHIDVTSKGVTSTKKGFDELVGAEKNLEQQTAKVIKIQASMERRLETIARKHDAEYRSAQDVAQAYRDLERAANHGLSGSKAFEAAQAGLTRTQQKLSASLDSVTSRLSKYNSMISKLDQWSAFERAARDAIKPVDELSQKMGAFYASTTSMTGRLDAWTAAVRRLNEEANRPIAPASPMAAAMSANVRQSTSFAGRLSQWRAMEAFREEQANKPVSPMAAAMSAQHAQATSFIGRLNTWTAAQKNLNAAVATGGKTAKLSGADYANLSAQIQDMVVSVGSGASLITTGLQQIPQFADVFARKPVEERTAAIKEFGVTLLRLATHPLTLFAAGAATAAAAVYKWQQATDALTKSLNGLGRASGVTLGGASQIAATSAAQTGISTGYARNLASQFLGAGVSGSNLGGAIGLAKPLGRTVGIGSEDLSSALGNPAKGAQELATKYGLLSYAQERRVRELAAEGRQVEATTELISALRGSIEKLQDPTTKLFDAFEKGAAKIANAFSWIGERLASIPGSPFASVSGPGSQADAEKARVSGLLNSALRRQEGLDTIAQDAALAAREITAQTYAQREAVTTERERVQVLRETLDVTRASLSAEAARVRVLAQAQAALQDYVRAGQQERSLLGKTSFQRGLQEIENRFQDLSRELPSPGRGALSAPLVTGKSTATKQMDILLRTAQERGLEPTEATFDALIKEGVGKSFLKGKLLSSASDLSSTVNMPTASGTGFSASAMAERDAQRAAFATEAQRAPLREMTKDLADQARVLDIQRDSFFNSTAEIEKAVKKQELLNQYNREGIPVTADMKVAIDALAEEYGRLAEEQEKVGISQNRLREAIENTRSLTHDTFSGFFSDLQRGVTIGEAFNGVLDRIRQKVVDIAANNLTDSLFGTKANASNGLLGGVFKGLGGLFGGGSGAAGGGAFSTPLFSGKAFSFGFADGGIMTSAGPLPLHRYASGGIADSPQLAMFGEGRGAEAYVPLPDGRRIPVKMDGHAGGERSNAPSVQVHNYAAGVEVQPRMTPEGVALIVQEVGGRMLAANNKRIPGMLTDSQRRANR